MAESVVNSIDSAPNPIGDIFWPEGVSRATPGSVLHCVDAIVEIGGEYPDQATELGLINSIMAAKDMLQATDPVVVAPASARRIIFELNTNLHAIVPTAPSTQELTEEAAA